MAEAPKNKSYILIAILAVIWGSSFILIKKGIDVYTPFQVGAIRIFVAAIALFPFIFRSFGKIEKSKWKYLAATGFLGNGIPAILFPLAETNISSAVAGMINSLTPIFTLIAGMLFFGMKGGRNRISGLLIGLLGAVLLIFGRSGGGLQGNPLFVWYIVAATICYALSVNVIRSYLTDLGSIRTTGFALFIAGVPMGIYLFSTDFIHRTRVTEGAGFSMLCIVLLGLLSTALSTVLFNKLIKISGALVASSVTYLIPIVATVWGLADHESLGYLHLAGLGGILGGVYLINKKS